MNLICSIGCNISQNLSFSYYRMSDVRVSHHKISPKLSVTYHFQPSHLSAIIISITQIFSGMNLMLFYRGEY
jgi:hypothetical protein